MELTGTRGQQYWTHYFDASGTITSGGTAQLIVPVALKRSFWVFVNNSSSNMNLEFGAARATAIITSGAVTSISVTNVGFGYSKPPRVIFLGGGNTGNNQNNPTFGSATLPDYPAPANPAQAHCVMTGSAPNMTVSSIAIDNPGSGYAIAPYVLLENDPNDAYGAAAPSATVGVTILPNGSWSSNGVVCTTDQISVFCATTGASYTFKYCTG